ncbi:THAP domain-containing protein 7 isoform 2-T2 [Clarias gariepinus]
MLIETPSGLKGKSSRRRNKTRNEDQQSSTTGKTNKESSNSKDTQIKEPLIDVVGDEEAESNKTANEEHKKEKPSLLPLPLKESVPDQVTETPSTPPSPSRYMRRLPPPPGFYLAKEHSYAQLCPLEWRKRNEKATDNLEKALRLLRSARRRENRLRITLLRLQDNRLKQTLSQIQDRRKETQESQSRSGQGRQSGKLSRSGQDRGLERMEENEMEGAGEIIELLTEESWGKEHTTKLKYGVEDEEGCCFYCGRGREDEESKVGRNQVGPHRSTGRRGRGRNVSNVLRETVQEMAESKGQSKPSVHQNINSDQLTLLHSHPEMLLQMHALPGPTQSTATFQEPLPQLQHLHLLQPDLSLLHSDAATTDISITQSEDAGGGMCHVFLVPVSSETKEKSTIGVDGLIQRTQSVLVAEETLQHIVSEQGDGLTIQSDDMGLSHSEQRVSQNDQQINVRSMLVGEDVAQRLKEHLEGFQLQLSSEFID